MITPPTVIDPLDSTKDQILVENTAQTVLKHLNDLEMKRSIVVSRWIWELLQNARDAAPHDRDLRVQIELCDDCLTFRHNGIPFTNDAIAHLIYHGSTKQADESALGQFGTGFISTHLLSRVINVSGSLTDQRRFRFSLSREGNEAATIGSSMERSWKEFKSSLQADSNPIGPFTTEFSYPLSGETKLVVNEGLVALRSAAPFILVFNPLYHRIEVIGKVEWSVVRAEVTDLAGASCVSFSGTAFDNLAIAVAKDQELSVAIAAERKGEKWAILCEDVPRIFLAFPLYGTRAFAFPAVMNSMAFIPLEDRNEIYLIDQKLHQANMELVARACTLLASLATTLAKEGWDALHNLTVISPVVPGQVLDARWLARTLRERLVFGLRNAELVPVMNGNRVKPCDAWIPNSQNDELNDRLWSLTAGFKQSAAKLPSKSVADSWLQSLISWVPLFDSGIKDLPESFGILNLAEMVGKAGSVSSLREQLAEDLEPAPWLNEFYRLIFDGDLGDIFNQRPLVPDQTGMFRKLSELYRDDAIPEELKAQAEALGVNVRTKLLNLNIESQTIRDRLRPLGTNDVVSQSIAALKSLAQQRPLPSGFLDQNVSMFLWLLEHGRFADLEGFPAFHSDPDSENRFIVLSSKPPDHSLTPLAPAALWPSDASTFAQLFPQEFLLSQSYAPDSNRMELWAEMARRGFVRTGPLHDSSVFFERFLPDEPLDREQDHRSKARDHRSKIRVEASEIAFLTASDHHGILDSTRKSKKLAVALWQFLATYVVRSDLKAFTQQSVECECGKFHNVLRAAWLIPLAERIWVPLADGKSDKATADSLAPLFEENEQLRAILANGTATEILRAIGVSTANLALQTLGANEDDRLAMVQSLTLLTEAVGQDVQRLRAVADALRDNPGFVEEIERQKQVREKIHKNQDIGRLVEALLRAALETADLKVERTGIGSDFEVGNDFVDEGIEIGLRISTASRTCLLEVKATTVKTVRMTPAQAKMAVNEKDRFALCMIMIPDDSPTEQLVRDGARFVFDIGTRLEGIWNGYEDVQDATQDAVAPQGDIQLEMAEAVTRFRVGADTWASGMTFEQAVAHLRNI